MNRFMRFSLIFYAFTLSVLSVIIGLILFDSSKLEAIYIIFSRYLIQSTAKWVLFAFLLFIFISSLTILIYALKSGRIRKKRVRSTEIGTIDIGVDAIENIILNSATISQSGIKSSKARVYSGKSGKIRAELSAILYSGVEIPAMMAKVQDMVKKDIERYTGIPVEKVTVKVNRVENIAAKVER